MSTVAAAAAAASSCAGTTTTTARRRGILMILSPAKTLDRTPFEASLLHGLSLTPPNLTSSLSSSSPENNKTVQIVTAMKQKSKAELTKLLSLSPNLAQSVYDDWKKFETKQHNLTTTSTILANNNNNKNQHKPCIFAMNGPAFQALQPQDCSAETLQYLQDNLRILDAVYGVLRPLDLMQPCRLEMQTKNVFASKKTEKPIKLVDFWKETITTCLTDELQEREKKYDDDNNNKKDGKQKKSRKPILINLASEEYSAAMDVSSNSINRNCYQWVDCKFFEASGRVVAVHAKRARGLMARFLADQQADSIHDILKFNLEGYSLVSDLSSSLSSIDKEEDNHIILVFQRTTKATTKTTTTKQRSTKASAAAAAGTKKRTAPAPKKSPVETTTTTTTTTTDNKKKTKRSKQ